MSSCSLHYSQFNFTADFILDRRLKYDVIQIHWGA